VLNESWPDLLKSGLLGEELSQQGNDHYNCSRSTSIIGAVKETKCHLYFFLNKPEWIQGASEPL